MADIPTGRGAATMRVEALAISLPAGFEHRAARIGRLTAERLAAVPPPARHGEMPLLRVPPLRLRAGWSDQRIAAALASAIRHRLDGGL